MDTRKNAWVNSLFLFLTLAINTLGALGKINGLSQKDVSDRYPTLLTPSPTTFSIWGLIYTLLILSAIFMIIKSEESYYRQVIKELSSLFRISCIFNIAWIVSFSFVLIEVSFFVIWILFLILYFIFKQLIELQDGKHWLLPLTFAFYSGWLFMASVLNSLVTLVRNGLDPYGSLGNILSIIFLFLAIILVIFLQQKHHHAAFPLPIAWALWGVFQSLKAIEGYRFLQALAFGGMLILILVAVIQFYYNQYALLPKNNVNNS